MEKFSTKDPRKNAMVRLAGGDYITLNSSITNDITRWMLEMHPTHQRNWEYLCCLSAGADTKDKIRQIPWGKLSCKPTEVYKWIDSHNFGLRELIAYFKQIDSPLHLKLEAHLDYETEAHFSDIKSGGYVATFLADYHQITI